MRSLILLLLVVLFGPLAVAHEGGGPHLGLGEPSPRVHEAVVEPALAGPVPRPALVTGELTTARFRILHTARSEQAARKLAAEIEAVRDGFGKVLGRDWTGTTEIRIGVGRQEFEALALPGGAPPRWAVALAYPVHQIVLLDAVSHNSPEGSTTLRHELAHVALGQLGRAWPRWFQEGLAQNLTGERFSMTHYATLYRAVTQERVYHFEDLAEGFPDLPSDVEIAYAQSAAFVAWLTSRYGPEVMGKLVDGVGAGENFELAFGKAFRTSLSVEEKAWRDELATRYGWLPLTTSIALVWLLASLLVIPAWLRRRYQKQERLAALAAEEAAEDSALRILAAEAEQRGMPLPAETLRPEWEGEPPLPGPNPLADEDSNPGLDPERPPKPTLH
jgi:hypothetical protein